MNTIETERLLLRPWKIDDAAEAASLFRYASDPEIGLRCGWPPHTSVEGSMHDIRNILAVENNWAITIKGGAPNSNAPVAASRSSPSATAPPTPLPPILNSPNATASTLATARWNSDTGSAGRSGARDTCPKH